MQQKDGKVLFYVRVCTSATGQDDNKNDTGNVDKSKVRQLLGILKLI